MTHFLSPARLHLEGGGGGVVLGNGISRLERGDRGTCGNGLMGAESEWL